MQILVACEESQAVTIALRKLGHEAYSCDLIPCSGGHPEWHIQQDVLPLLNGYCFFKTCDGSAHYVLGRWDMLIAFPPCTYLTNASAVRMRVVGTLTDHDVTAIAALTGTSFVTDGAWGGFYYWKSKNENRAKYAQRFLNKFADKYGADAALRAAEIVLKD